MQAASHTCPVSDPTPPVGPAAMREAVGDYIEVLHATYLEHVDHLPPGERAVLPLVAAGRVTVVAAAARRLHLVATTEPLPAPAGPEVELAGRYRGLSWTVRFYDPSLLPDLGLLTDDDARAVRRILGITDVVYHLTVSIGGGLGSHHAQHSGVALANGDARVHRDLERIRRALPDRSGLVDELATCVRLGLDRAAALLAAELTVGRVSAVGDAPASDRLHAVLADVTR